MLSVALSRLLCVCIPMILLPLIDDYEENCFERVSGPSGSPGLRHGEPTASGAHPTIWLLHRIHLAGDAWPRQTRFALQCAPNRLIEQLRITGENELESSNAGGVFGRSSG